MIEFSERDRDLVEDFLNHVLERYKAGSIGRPAALHRSGEDE
ncbi:hypothetical protein [Methylobacterium gregans]|nr:hypothetical protein [Methylobacterium gregans]MDQ0519126.1 hypothetical protein [Methylobacterium gregans]